MKLTLVDFLAKWQAYMILHPDQRKGQAMLNLLGTLGYDKLYTELDSRFSVFYNDKQINEAIGFLAVELN